MRASATCISIFTSVVVTGCGSESPSDSDSGLDASVSSDAQTGLIDVEPPDTPDPTRIALPPDAWDCLDGWRRERIGDAIICHPWPESGPEDCGPGEAHLPGEPGCRRIGSPCPEDGLPAGPFPTENVVYFLAGATGGDGSRQRPHGRLDAIDFNALPSDTTVAFGVGEYSGSVEILRPDLFLVGACTERTVFRARGPIANPAVFTLTAPVVTLENLTVSGSDHPAILVSGGRGGLSRVRARSVIIEDIDATFAVSVEGFASLSTNELVIRRVNGLGIQTGLPGAVTALEDSLIAQATGVGMIVSDGAGSTVVNSAIMDVLPLSSGFGAGFFVQRGSSASIIGLSVRNAAGHGILASGQNGGISTVRLADCHVERTGRSGVDPGWGVRAAGYSNVIVLRCAALDNLGGGWLVRGVSSRMQLFDSLSYGNRALAAGEAGYGVTVDDGGRAELRRVAMADNVNAGLWVGPGGSVEGGDVIIRGTRAPADAPESGAGVRVTDGLATLSRLESADHDGPGLVADGLLGNVQIDDLRTARTSGGVLIDEALVTGSRWTVQHGVGRGVQVEDAEPIIDQLRIESTRAREDGEADALVLQGAGTLRSQSLQVYGSDRCGVRLAGSSAEPLSFERAQLIENEIAVCGADDRVSDLLQRAELIDNVRDRAEVEP
jgi:hypothetical protein